MRSEQRGVTFLGLLVTCAVLIFAGMVGLQLVPAYIESVAVQKAVERSAEGTTVAEVRSIFDKAAQIDDIRSISGKDLEVFKEAGRVVVSYAYNREIHLAGPAYLVMKFNGRSQ